MRTFILIFLLNAICQCSAYLYIFIYIYVYSVKEKYRENFHDDRYLRFPSQVRSLTVYNVGICQCTLGF